MANDKKKKLNTFKPAKYTKIDLTILKEMPELKGSRTKVYQMIQETQGTIEGRCFA